MMLPINECSEAKRDSVQYIHVYMHKYTYVSTRNWYMYKVWFKPLSPKSDQHEISPYYINALENRVVMRIECMIKEDESNW